MRRAILGVGLVATLGWAAEPAAPEPPRAPQQWGAITMFHGLPSPKVRAIAQDEDGILWFGTDAGLVRYDGLRLERAALPTPSAGIRALAAGPHGSLWVATEAGAFVRRGHGFAVVPRTADHAIDAILAGPDGRAWLAGDRGIVFACTLAAGDVVEVSPLGPEQAGLLRDRRGGPLPLLALGRRDSTLLIGTGGRGLLFARDGRVEEMKDPARPFFVTAAASDRAGRVLFGAETSAEGRGVFALEEDAGRALDVRTGPVTALAFDASGDLWVGTRNHGLIDVRDGRAVLGLTLETSGGALSSNTVLAVFADRDGVLWIGTDRGVCRYDPGSPRSQRLGATPRGNFVHALLLARDGRLWAGTQRGLFVREARGGSWRSVAALGDHTIHAIAETEEGRMLVGTPSGLLGTAANEGEWATIAPPENAPGSGESVRAIRTVGGAAYVATFGRGVERLVGGERVGVWPDPSAPDALREVVSLSVAGDALWIGTASAGSFVLRSGNVTRDAELGAHGMLRSVADDGAGGLWVGTDRGVFRRTQGRLEPVAEGLEARALLPEPGPTPSLWCATSSGLLKIAVAPGMGFVTSRLGTDYGLPSDSLFALVAVPTSSREVGLVLGTNRGLASYDPGRVPPGVRIVRVLGRRAYPPEEWPGLRLEYPQNSLLVETAAIGSRTYPEHFQYVFSLSSGDGRRLRSRLSRDGQFVAESLSPGAYCLKARALSVDLRASAPVSLCFEVARAPWPWTSLSLGILLGGALLALAWGYRLNRRLADANVALSETRLQLVQETENERRRIARDLHDQTLADLRHLLLIAEPYREAVESISTEVRRICEDLSPSVLENVGLMPALEWALEESVRHLPPERACKATFACASDVEDRLCLDGSVKLQIYRMVQEALSNVARHAHATGVRLSVTLRDGGTLEISVEDDGRGFEISSAAIGRGIANLRSRASLIGAEIAWSPRPGGGTVFRLRKAGAAQR